MIYLYSVPHLKIEWLIQRAFFSHIHEYRGCLLSYSSLNFAAGFFGVRTYTTDYHQLITVESSGINNTLAPYLVCPNANNDIGALGGVQAGKWMAIYLAPGTKRLGSMIKGVNLTVTDLFDMQLTCAYEVSMMLGYYGSKFPVFMCSLSFFRRLRWVTPSSVIFLLKTNGKDLNMQWYVIYSCVTFTCAVLIIPPP